MHCMCIRFSGYAIQLLVRSCSMYLDEVQSHSCSGLCIQEMCLWRESFCNQWLSYFDWWICMAGSMFVHIFVTARISITDIAATKCQCIAMGSTATNLILQIETISIQLNPISTTEVITYKLLTNTRAIICQNFTTYVGYSCPSFHHKKLWSLILMGHPHLFHAETISISLWRGNATMWIRWFPIRSAEADSME